MNGHKRILLVSSSGGVLLDLLALEPWWARYGTVWAAVKAADTASVLSGLRVHWVSEISVRRPFALVVGFVQAWCILRRERPELVISAGSGPAIPFFVIARVMGIP